MHPVSELPDNVKRLREIIRDCTLCPRNCHVDRAAGVLGACGIGADPLVASAGAHVGEEPVLVGRRGSGTIFFCGCNLHCVFCQNYDISQSADGRKMSPEEVAEVAITLTSQGCSNVNFVSPSHVAHVLAEAVCIARGRGMGAPIIYNCGGYDSVETLRLLDGLIEIYMPDFKWASPDAGLKYSDAPDYPRIAEAALREMFRQVGPLQTDSRGIATRGVLVRHLVIPGNLAHSDEVIDVVAREAPGCAINVMGQYRPAHRAGNYPELLARARPEEVLRLRQYAAERGLQRVDH
jgi:putative pyruvate formate lyase activating enzyme